MSPRTLTGRLEALEASLEGGSIVGLWTHDEEGRPVRHALVGHRVSVEGWLATGHLPRGASLLLIPGRDADVTDTSRPWRAFPPDLHPEALRAFQRVLETGTCLPHPDRHGGAS